MWVKISKHNYPILGLFGSALLIFMVEIAMVSIILVAPLRKILNYFSVIQDATVAPPHTQIICYIFFKKLKKLFFF